MPDRDVLPLHASVSTFEDCRSSGSQPATAMMHVHPFVSGYCMVQIVNRICTEKAQRSWPLLPGNMSKQKVAVTLPVVEASCSK